MGRTPNRDLMRAVQVSDSAPVTIAQLAVGLVWTYTLGPDGFTQLRQRYRLGANPRKGQMHLDAPFPKDSPHSL